MDRWTSIILELLKSSWVTAVAIPTGLTYVQGAAKAASKPKGPFPLTFFLRPSRIRHSDRALGLDLLFAAVGSQLSFLAAYAVGVAPTGLGPGARTLPANLGVRVHDKIQLSAYLLLVVLVALLVVAIATRLRGHESSDPGADLREEFVTAPNMLGWFLLVTVWGLGAP